MCSCHDKTGKWSGDHDISGKIAKNPCEKNEMLDETR
jgi:hypothetical protein